LLQNHLRMGAQLVLPDQSVQCEGAHPLGQLDRSQPREHAVVHHGEEIAVYNLCDLIRRARLGFTRMGFLNLFSKKLLDLGNSHLLSRIRRQRKPREYPEKQQEPQLK